MSEHTSENVLVKKIAADTQSRIDEIQAQANAEVADIERATTKQVEELQAAAQLQLKKKQQQIELVGMSKARQAANIALQSAKRNVIDTAFTTAFSELAAMPAEEYVSFFTKQVAKVLPSRSTITSVSAPAHRLAETQAIVKTVSEQAPAVNPAMNIKAGLLIETTDGVFDITLERLVSEQRSVLEMEVVKEVTVN